MTVTVPNDKKRLNGVSAESEMCDWLKAKKIDAAAARPGPNFQKASTERRQFVTGIPEGASAGSIFLCGQV